MKKLLVAGAALLVIALVLLWKLAGSGGGAVTAAPPALEAPAPPKLAAPMKPAAARVTVAEVEPAPPLMPKKLEIGTDEFFYRWDEQVVPNLSRAAIKCVENSNKQIMRYQSSVLTYDIRVKDGEVSLANVKLAESSIGDAAIENCFVKEVLHVAWHDDELPDLEELNQRIKLSPDRGMKKYRQDNIDYVGKALQAPTRDD